MIIGNIGVQRSTRVLCDFLEMMGAKLGFEERRKKNSNSKHNAYHVLGSVQSILDMLTF